MPAKFIPCKSYEATHVRLTDKKRHPSLINGGIYEYYYDSNPWEDTHYIIGENGIPFYDFECVINCEYLKEVKS